MALALCRECKEQVSEDARACPRCGAPFPTNQKWNGWGYEWKSKGTLLGLPWIHIAIGRTKARKLRVARGIIAIGQYAVGVFTLAQFGIGVFAITQFGLGGWVLAQFGAGVHCIAQFSAALLSGKGQFIILLKDLL